MLFLVGFGLISLFSYFIDKNGLSIFSLIVAVLAFQLSQLRQSKLESSREILFDRQWQDILSRWKAIGLSDPDITAISIYIAEDHKLYGWKVPKADELTNGTGLANFRSQ